MEAGTGHLQCYSLFFLVPNINTIKLQLTDNLINQKAELKRTERQKMDKPQTDNLKTNRLNSSIDIDSIGQYVAVLYTEPRPQYYWGIVTKTFSDDEETNVMKIEVDFLQKKTLSSDPSLWTWTEKTKKDIDIVSVN